MHIKFREGVLRVAVVSPLVFLTFMQAASLRPLQDDYFALGVLTSSSVIEMTQNVWNFQGGNILPYFIQTLLLQITSHSLNFYGYKLFYFVTLACVISANRILLKWLIGYKFKYFTWNIEVLICIVSLLVFEGLFVPGTLGAYSFGLASLAHLWPITLLIISLNYLNKGSKNYILASLAGLIMGNSNAGESLTCVLLLGSILFYRLKKRHEYRAGNDGFLNCLFTGTLIGFICIFSAPGFWNRANVSVGLPESLSELLFRFIRALSSFSADLATHPILWAAFIGGLILGERILQTNSKNDFENKLKLLLVFGLLLYILLILGSSFAYVSWHQAFGLYQVWLILSFALGIKIRNSATLFKGKIGPRGTHKAAVFFISICFIYTGFTSTFGAAARAAKWDESFRFNYCALKIDDDLPLRSAELIYPIFNLGIEDVNSWDWMRDGYVKWISSDKFNSEIKCK